MQKMPLKDRLQELRTKAGFSMSQVQRISEKYKNIDPRRYITQGYISRLEHGVERNPSLLKLLTLCKIYKISLSKFFRSLLLE